MSKMRQLTAVSVAVLLFGFGFPSIAAERRQIRWN